MNEQKSYGFQKRLQRLELSNKPTLVITEKLKKQIDYLHHKVGTKEWSGELITREEGTITELDNWKVIAEDIFLADVGSGAFTGYEVDKGGFKTVDIIEMYDVFDGLLTGTHKNHHIHTHHSMGAFFSGTDWEQLEDRGVLCNYFIMLVVDFASTYKAKCAFKGKRKISTSPTLEFVNNADGYTPFTMKNEDRDEEMLVVMDMNVEIPTVSHVVPLDQDVRSVMEELSKTPEAEETHLDILLKYLNECVKDKVYMVDEPFRVRYQSVVKAIEEDNSKKTVYTPFTPKKQGNLFNEVDDDFGYNYNRNWDNYRWDSTEKKWVEKEQHVKGKKISEMTDKEFKDFQEEKESQMEWEEKHIKILLNACITQTWSEDETTDPIKELHKLGKKIKAKNEREEWMEDFRMEIGSKVYEMWIPQAELLPEDALCLLDMCLDYLKDECKDRFIQLVYQTIQEERRFILEETQYYSNYQGRGGHV